ncbi:acyltransferase [Cellulomonas sp. PS-H5]|uniref:acyltransferase family protein n=1 Tax=Cellulomonas sp. PS-H5 TaxID=2820400 RepID=UPI001C4F84BB|nr:acyltransferase [Cellulomonas sp. PS-H5]MBW0254182.1 acyltransferase [Cellulomonas sp. PS-H5]
MTIETTTSARVEGVDALRGLAAIAVFVCHIGGYWGFLDLPGKLPQLVAAGAHGVDVFIVISGFCLALPLAGHRRPLRVPQFYGRRAWRILPPYYVALAIAAVLALLPATWHLTVARQASLGDVLLHVVTGQAWVPGEVGTINGSLWSVALEVQLYLLFPLLVVAWRRWGIAPVLVGAVALDLAWRGSGALGGPAPLGSDLVVPARLDQFVGGMACAVAIRAGFTWSVRRGLVVFAIATLAALGTSTLDLGVFTGVAWAAAGSSAVLLLAGPLGRALGGTVLDRFGARSFSFYLLHQPVLLVGAPVVALLPGGTAVRLVVGGLAAFGATALLAELMYRGVELPSHHAGRRRFPVTVALPPSTRVTARDDRRDDLPEPTPV